MGHNKKKKKHKSKNRKHSSDSESIPEPAKKQKIIGPCLPTYLPSAAPAPSTSTQDDSYGPQLPPHLTKPKPPIQPPQNPESDNDDVIGPLPADVQISSAAQQALDERAEILKYSFLLQVKLIFNTSNCRNVLLLWFRCYSQNNEDDDSAPQRDTWMTELPPEKAGFFGLGARKFKTSTNTGDPKNRALWTETPLDKNKPVTSCHILIHIKTTL